MQHFMLYFQSGSVVVWSKCWKKAAEWCRIFGFYSPSCQFIFNAL